MFIFIISGSISLGSTVLGLGQLTTIISICYGLTWILDLIIVSINKIFDLSANSKNRVFLVSIGTKMEKIYYTEISSCWPRLITYHGGSYDYFSTSISCIYIYI